MTQTPINYWYCPQCECEVDNRNVTNDEKHDNCGTEVESRQHVQTPIEKAISELDYSILFVQENQFPSESKNVELIVLNNIRRRLVGIKDIYEKKHLRDVAENTWDECRKSTVDNVSIEHDPVRDMEFIEIDYSSIDKDKQTYLNQNHPL